MAGCSIRSAPQFNVEPCAWKSRLSRTCCSIPSRRPSSSTPSAPAMSPARCSCWRSAPCICCAAGICEIAKRSMTVAASFGLASALSVVVLGDESGYTAGQNQKMKIAAIEAMWDTEPAPASFTLFGIPDMKSADHALSRSAAVAARPDRHALARRAGPGDQAVGGDGGAAHPRWPDRRIRMRAAARRAQHDDPAGRWRRRSSDLGYALLLKRFRPDIENATDAQMHEAALRPCLTVATLFWCFRFMVAFGFYFIALFALAFIMASRRQLERRWFLRLALWSLPLPWLAAELGWIVAEYGRQPWIIDGILPTFLGASSEPAGNIWFSLIGFVAVLQHARHRRCLSDGQIRPSRPACAVRAPARPPGAGGRPALRRRHAADRLPDPALPLVGLARPAAHRLCRHGRLRSRRRAAPAAGRPGPTPRGACSSMP